jgi:excisionase family DNA binding protein
MMQVKQRDSSQGSEKRRLFDLLPSDIQNAMTEILAEALLRDLTEQPMKGPIFSSAVSDTLSAKRISTPDERLLLRATEVGRLLSVSRSKVYEMMASGELPTMKIGSALRVPRKQLLEWIEKRAER